MKPLSLLAPLLLVGCGSAQGLRPKQGVALPVAPYGADAPPSPNQLVTPTPQQRPQRSDSLLQSSQKRRSDEFDLPPTG